LESLRCRDCLVNGQGLATSLACVLRRVYHQDRHLPNALRGGLPDSESSSVLQHPSGSSRGREMVEVEQADPCDTRMTLDVSHRFKGSLKGLNSELDVRVVIDHANRRIDVLDGFGLPVNFNTALPKRRPALPIKEVHPGSRFFLEHIFSAVLLCHATAPFASVSPAVHRKL
jgi:hypothetical protein